MIELQCPTCGKLLKIPVEYRGQTGKCNGCGGPIAVPKAALTTTERDVLQSIGAAAPALTKEQIEYLNSLPDPPRWTQKVVTFLLDTAIGAGRFALSLFESKPSRSWRNDPMTERQEEFLLSLGAEEHEIEGLTKGQASDRIAYLKGEPVGMSHEKQLLREAKKQTRIAKANRSDTTCCLGCLIILVILFFTGLLGPLLAIVGIGGAIATQ